MLIWSVSLFLLFRNMVIRENKLINLLASTTLGIYLLHIMFVGIVSNYWLAALIALAISIASYEILKRIKYANRWLFGGTPLLTAK